VGIRVCPVIRAVIYTRVSQDRWAGKRSVGEQEAECRTVATDHGWTVVGVFTDNDRSASRYAKKLRPGFTELLAFIEAGNAEVLMTWEPSRASRDLTTFLPLREALINRRMTWTTADDSFDLAKASDRKRISHEAVDNEHESGRTSERVQRSVRANAAKGRPHGRFGFGYRRIYTVDPHGRKALTAVVDTSRKPPSCGRSRGGSWPGNSSTRSGGTSPHGGRRPRTAQPSGTAATCAG